MKYMWNCLSVLFIFILAESCQLNSAERKKPTIKQSLAKKNVSKIAIEKKYELPTELNEISGMAWLKENTFACIQDEEGIIYIYDVAQEKILQQIAFAGPGDYEGLTTDGNTAYVQRADGTIFSISNFLGKEVQVKEFKTGLTAQQNIEGITFDEKNNRLISVVKDQEPGKPNYKGVYAFNLNSFRLNETPVFKIPTSSNLYEQANLKKGTFYPSGISVNKASGHYFIVDGRQAGVLELDENGNLLKVYQLNKKDFAQPESVTFDAAGNIYISSEAGKGKAHISLVKILP